MTLRFTVVMLAALFVLPLSATEKVKVEKLTVKSLPAETYPLLQKGKKLSLVWKSPEFTPGRGFKVGEVSWKADDRLGEVTPYLKAQIAEIASASGFYTVDLAVTEAKASSTSWHGHTTHGYYLLEGRVKDGEGKVVAAFVTKEEHEQVGFDETLKPGIDRTVSGIASELFK